jgi:hypothetical protein
MKHTDRQTSTKTLIDLCRALGRREAVTITYVDSEGEVTIRTIEIHDIRTSKPTVHKDGTVTEGDMMILVMCRLRGDERELHLSGIVSYTLHRMAYVLDRPQPTTYERPAPAPVDDADALFFYELARDRDDADYRSRILITQAATTLAA